MPVSMCFLLLACLFQCVLCCASVCVNILRPCAQACVYPCSCRVLVCVNIFRPLPVLICFGSAPRPLSKFFMPHPRYPHPGLQLGGLLGVRPLAPAGRGGRRGAPRVAGRPRRCHPLQRFGAPRTHRARSPVEVHHGLVAGGDARRARWALSL